MSKLTDDVAKIVEPILEALGYELVEAEFNKKHGRDNLTLYIDHLDAEKGGITLEDCETAHHAVDPALEELDPTHGMPYILNVSSPGLDRHFKTQRDFERNYGKEVEVKLFAPLKGKKLYEGVLTERTQAITAITTLKGEALRLENTRIAFVRPLVKFE